MIAMMSEHNDILRPQFGGLEPEFSDPQRSAFAVLPVAYDATSSWMKGADRGPAALLNASANMELYDIETQSEVYRRGICTLEPIEFDGAPEALADMVDEQVKGVVSRGQIPVVLGGEHSVSIGAIRAVSRAVKGVSVLQIDAHGDTRDSYLGSKFNHACVMARAMEWCPVVQVGIRAIDVEETKRIDRDRVFFAHEVVNQPTTEWMDRAISKLTDDVYVTIDLDAFDPSYVPSTGTPEPGGFNWYEVNAFLSRVCETRRIVGFDVVELLPTQYHWASDFFAAKLVYRIMSMIGAAMPDGA